jgi:hypothetical protein
MVCPCVLLAEEKISKEQKQGKKVWIEKRKEKIVKEKRRDRKRSTQGTLSSSIICGTFCLVHISVATFHTCFYSYLFHSFVYHNSCKEHVYASN